jgi:hypothetical protein
VGNDQMGDVISNIIDLFTSTNHLKWVKCVSARELSEMLHGGSSVHLQSNFWKLFWLKRHIRWVGEFVWTLEWLAGVE